MILFCVLTSRSLGFIPVKSHVGLLPMWPGAEVWRGVGAWELPLWWALRTVFPKEKQARKCRGPQMA